MKCAVFIGLHDVYPTMYSFRCIHCSIILHHRSTKRFSADKQIKV